MSNPKLYEDSEASESRAAADQDLAQEEVLERARKGKEKAAREVMGEEGAGQKSTTATKAAMAPAVSHVSPGTSNGDPLLSFMKD
ncbi:uncharacterized protein LOC131245830 isoform X2 [Magnolia sinica]|uniref:uncharacterized protein LOC131245830 isoform X2 n=1 Tax=Magnolia sinica TaxID=86752 RepID=UPI00265A899D|nr:uncharacterized protein LOC131245830 isoform X2 [Magnolia sinica]